MKTPDDRINDLIARAGSPVMVVRSHDKQGEWWREHTQTIRNTVNREHDGSYELYIIRLVDTIDRMEAALSNVINERDQLLEDLHRSENSTGNCDFCKHYMAGEDLCNICDTHGNDMWEWRGVPNKEV